MLIRKKVLEESILVLSCKEGIVFNLTKFLHFLFDGISIKNMINLLLFFN